MAQPPKGAWKYLLSHGVTSLTAHPKAYPVLAFLSLLIIAAACIWNPEAVRGDPSRRMDLVYYIVATWLPGFAMYSYWTYGLLYGFETINWSHLFRACGRYMLAMLFVVVIFMIIMLPVGLVVGGLVALMKILGLPPVIAIIIGVIVGGAALVAMLFVMMRLSFVCLVAMVEGRISLKRSWAISRGWVGSLLASTFVVGLVTGVLPLLARWMGPSADVILYGIISAISSIIMILVYNSILVIAYKKAAQPEPQAVSSPVESF